MTTNPNHAPTEDDRHGVPELLTTAEVAALLRVHRNTLDSERDAGRLACTRIGSRVFYTPAQVRAYLNQQQGDRAEGCSTNRSGSTRVTGSSCGPTPPTTPSIGEAREIAVSGARARARAISKRPNASSLNSSGHEQIQSPNPPRTS
ncbi:MAG: helix-turn-helix domain-containing protein [Phycisphaeraceae bacterium]|nr:helix-turn-helix domain-containing protein [Phycisphaeraceae bacterium]MCB9848149.1 helix-turn-helix domain-containing protein [Phycisphaeraceae bacterium]